MAYLQELIQAQQQQINQQATNQAFVGLPEGEAYSQYFSTWEVTAPQYQQPNPYTLTGFYRTNEVAYACIDLRMNTISEPPTKVWDKKKEQFIDDHPYYELMEEPCPDISHTDFIKAVEMFLQISGVLAWEKNTKNNGGILNIWPMMPQYCSYMRGEGRLLRTIRYQPYTGLPYLDIDRDRVVLFSYIDPLYYGLKPFSPTMVLSDIIGVDNNMTKMINQFVLNGAFVSGVLTTEQIINAEDARFAKERFRQDHGGVNNAGDIVVLGKGLKFEKSGQTFREMTFPDLDARNETRICMAYKVPPILVSAKSGMDRATYSNYEQARKAWYEEVVTSEWKFLAECLTRDILRHFDQDKNHVIRFDTTDVKALQEDRNSMWGRASKAYKDRIIVRNDALKEMGLQPLPDGDPLGNEYYQTVMSQSSTTDDLDIAPGGEQVEGQDVTNQKQLLAPEKKPTKDEQDEEEKHFRTFAKRRLKENKANDIGEFEFKYVDIKRQRQLLSEFGVPDPDGKLLLEALLETVKAIKENRKPQDISIKAILPDMPNPVVNVENKIDLPEQKVFEIPTPQVTVNVEPTPININVPKLKSSKTTEKVKRDSGDNIDGKVGKTEYEYEE